MFTVHKQRGSKLAWTQVQGVLRSDEEEFQITEQELTIASIH